MLHPDRSELLVQPTTYNKNCPRTCLDARYTLPHLSLARNVERLTRDAPSDRSSETTSSSHRTQFRTNSQTKGLCNRLLDEANRLDHSPCRPYMSRWVVRLSRQHECSIFTVHCRLDRGESSPVRTRTGGSCHAPNTGRGSGFVPVQQ